MTIGSGLWESRFLWVRWVTVVLLAAAPSLTDQAAAAPSRARDGPYSLSVRVALSAAYDANAFFIDSMRGYYPAGVAVQPTLERRLWRGVRFELSGIEEVRRDLARFAHAHHQWNDVAWLNHSDFGAGADLVWSGWSAPWLARWSRFRNGEVRLTGRASNIRYRGDAAGVEKAHPPGNLQLGASAWAHLEWLRPAVSGGSPFGRLAYSIALFPGLGSRYERVDPFLSGYRGFYVVDGGLNALCDPVWPLDPNRSLGPALRTRFCTDLGRQFYNRLDWRNNVTVEAGLECRFVLFGASVVGSGMLGTRQFLNRVVYVPSFRPTGDFVAGLSLERRFQIIP